MPEVVLAAGSCISLGHMLGVGICLEYDLLKWQGFLHVLMADMAQVTQYLRRQHELLAGRTA